MSLKDEFGDGNESEFGEESDNSEETSGSGLTSGEETEENETSEDEDGPPVFKFVETSGVKFDHSNLEIKTLAAFFFSDRFFSLLVKQSNIYAKECIEKVCEISKDNKISRWKEISIAEMKIFLGLLLHMGPNNHPNITNYWSTDILYRMDLWRLMMSKNRFQLLLRFLHFSDSTTSDNDKLHKIAPIIHYFNLIMNDLYVPKRDICMTESKLLWHGLIKQNKTSRRVKLLQLCNSDGIVMKIKADLVNNVSSESVIELMDDYLDKGYVLYLKNFGNAVNLATELTNRKTYLCGTLQDKNKQVCKGLFKARKNEVSWKRKGPIVLCKWNDLIGISNMHKLTADDYKSQKPRIIDDYNDTTSALNLPDYGYYYMSISKTISWSKKVILQIVEIFIRNIHILYQKLTESKISYLKFRGEVVKFMLADKLQSLSLKNAQKRKNKLHYLEALPPTDKKARPTKLCRVCTRTKKRKESRYFCPACEEKPVLCVENCFRIYHK